MKTFLAGDCRKENIFHLMDPVAFSEIEFEAEVVRALTCLLPDYHCGVFRGSFVFDGDRRSADLALIHKALTHWFVVEVELVSHSLEHHVLPQVRCFRFGEAEHACVTSLLSGFPHLTKTRAQALLDYVPRHVVVIANQMDPEWKASLMGLDTQLLALAVFEGGADRRAYELEGRVFARLENLGFAKYSATDKSLVISRNCGLPVGALRIEDEAGTPALWTARDNGGSLWITKNIGDPMLPPDRYVQIIRSIDGRISLRVQ